MKMPTANQLSFLSPPELFVIGQLFDGVRHHAKRLDDQNILIEHNRLVPRHMLTMGSDIVKSLNSTVREAEIDVEIAMQYILNVPEKDLPSTESLRFVLLGKGSHPIAPHRRREIVKLFKLYVACLSDGTPASDSGNSDVNTERKEEQITEAAKSFLRRNQATKLPAPVTFQQEATAPDTMETVVIRQLARECYEPIEVRLTGSAHIESQNYRQHTVGLRVVDKHGTSTSCHLQVFYNPDPRKNFRETIKQLESPLGSVNYEVIKRRSAAGKISYELVSISPGESFNHQSNLPLVDSAQKKPGFSGPTT